MEMLCASLWTQAIFCMQGYLSFTYMYGMYSGKCAVQNVIEYDRKPRKLTIKSEHSSAYKN